MSESTPRSKKLIFLPFLALLWIEVACIWFTLISDGSLQNPLYFIVGCLWLATLVMAHYAYFKDSIRRDNSSVFLGALLFSLVPMIGLLTSTSYITTSAVALFISFFVPVFFALIIFSKHFRK